MAQYEYKVVPAPVRGLRAKGVKGAEARFAHALSTLMNELGRAGWEYQRAETLPCEERSGLLAGKKTTQRNMLIFRRTIAPTAEAAKELAEDVPQSPERVAEAAAATLSADPAARPAAATQAGRRPSLGPARGQGFAAPRGSTGVSVE